jgi:hypothetical protein
MERKHGKNRVRDQISKLLLNQARDEDGLAPSEAAQIIQRRGQMS